MSERVWWVAADGATIELTDEVNYRVMWGRTGAWMPVFERVEELVPLQPGSRLREVRAAPREVDLPLLIRAASESAFDALVRSLGRALQPDLGDGRLRVRTADGTTRELVCRYAAGLEGDESITAVGDRWATAIVTFRATDPYWYASSTTSEAFDVNAGFFPFFPFNLLGSRGYRTANINNVGDVLAWPQWVVTGPGDNLVLANVTTGKRLALHSATSEALLAAGQQVIVDTRPGYKTVVDHNGVSLYPLLTAWDLWPLVRGINRVRVELAGTSDATSVVMTWVPGYNRP